MPDGQLTNAPTQQATRKMLTSQVITIGAASVASTVLARGIHRICATDQCWVRQGGSSVAAVSATAGSSLLPAGAIDDITVEEPAKDGYLAVIGTSGSLSITPHR